MVGYERNFGFKKEIIRPAVAASPMVRRTKERSVSKWKASIYVSIVFIRQSAEIQYTGTGVKCSCDKSSSGSPGHI